MIDNISVNKSGNFVVGANTKDFLEFLDNNLREIHRTDYRTIKENCKAKSFTMVLTPDDMIHVLNHYAFLTPEEI